MLKKSVYSLALGTLLLTSCANDEPVVTHSDGLVTFHATLPTQMLSRATDNLTIYDNGEQATNLSYAVYDEDNQNISTLNGTETMSGLGANVSLNLVTGKTYTIVFWAQAPDAPYAFDAATGKMTVTPTGNAQDLKRDAFYACEKFTVTGAVNKEVVLERPFAQINIGTSDLDDFINAGGSISKSGMTLTAPTVLNCLDGTVDAESEYVLAPETFVDNETTKISFPVATAPAQKYLTTAFILVDRSKSLVDVTWTSDNASRGEVTYTNIPVQRNYRTNIYGRLLTNPAEYNVRIAPEFTDEINDAAVVVKNSDGTVKCITPALPAGVTVEDLTGKGGVALNAEGAPVYFEPTGKSINDAMKNATEIFFAPNATISTTSHIMVVPQTGITIHGNGATITGGEQDFSVQTAYEDGSTVNLTINNLNGVKVWGGQSGTHTLNINLNNCSLSGSGRTDGSKSLVMVRGTNDQATVNINLDGCYMQDAQVAVHSIYGGEVTINNCTFKEVGVPINIAKKSNTMTAEVAVENCTFVNCGISSTDTGNSAYNYAAPVRVVDNGGPAKSVKVTVDKCAFEGTLSEWDVLLMDYRSGKTWFPIDYTVANCEPSSPNVKAEM